MKKICAARITLLISLLILSGSIQAFADGAGESHNLGELLPFWSVLPFVGMLLSIAIFPLVKPEWWERNMILVAVFWSAIFLIPF